RQHDDELAFGSQSRDRPYLIGEIDLAPLHLRDLLPARGAEQQKLVDIAERCRQLVRGFPESAHFAVAENAVADDLGRWPLDPKAWRAGDDVIVGEPSKELPQMTQRPVCHGRSRGGDLTDPLLDVPADDAVDAAPPPCWDDDIVENMLGLALIVRSRLLPHVFP